jgi:hypothetical protein
VRANTKKHNLYRQEKVHQTFAVHVHVLVELMHN